MPKGTGDNDNVGKLETPGRRLDAAARVAPGVRAEKEVKLRGEERAPLMYLFRAGIVLH